MDKYLSHSDQATEAQLEHIKRVAQERVNYIRWIAAKLLITEDQVIRKEAAQILVQLTEGRMTQGRRLIAALKRKPHTYMEMLALGVSVAPWVRVRESLSGLEFISKGERVVGKRKLVTWQVVKESK